MCTQKAKSCEDDLQTIRSITIHLWRVDACLVGSTVVRRDGCLEVLLPTRALAGGFAVAFGNLPFALLRRITRPVLLSRFYRHIMRMIYCCAALRFAAIREPPGWAARVLGGVVDGCFHSFAVVEGPKERDEGSPTSGAWGGTVERCVSGGGAVVRGLSVLEKRLRGRF